MGLFQRIGQVFNRVETGLPNPRLGTGYVVPWMWVPDGLRLQPRDSLQVGVVYACVRIISQVIASSPWNVVKVESGRRTRLPDDALSYLLNTRPNQDSTAQAVKEGLLAQLLVFGNAYAEIEWGRNGMPIGIWPLLSERMWPPTRDENGDLVYEYYAANGKKSLIPPAHILHFRGTSIDGLMGVGTVTLAARAIAHAAAVERYGISYFANAATPSGVLLSPKPLQPQEREALRTEFASKYAGDRNSGLPLVLSNGTTWQPVSNDPQKSQLSETRPQTVEEISRWFGVPLHLLSDPKGAQGYGSNLGELGLGFVRYTLAPLCRGIEQECEYKLVPPRQPKVISIDLSHVSLGNAKEVAETDEIRIRSGVLTPNEAREKAGYNHGEEHLDEHLVQSSMTTLKGVVEAAEGEGEEPEQDDAGESEGADSDDSLVVTRARIAIVTAYALALDAHARAWRARERDIAAHVAPKHAETKAAEAREELRKRLFDRLSSITDGADLPQLADAVEQGADPKQVASHHLGAKA